MKYKAHIFPKLPQVWVDENTSVDLTGEKWNSVAASLVSFVNENHPNVLIEHQVNGGNVGKVLEAEEREDGIWATIEVDPELTPPNPRWVSPRIIWNHTDVTGRKWPAALGELSFVSFPRFLVGQNDLQEVKMNQSGVNPTFQWSSEISPMAQPNKEATMTPEVLEEIKKVVAEMLAAAAPAPAKEEVKVEETVPMAEVEIEVGEEAPEKEDVPSLEAVMADPAMVADPDAYVAGLPEEEVRTAMASYLRQACMRQKEAVMSQIKSDLKARSMDESLADEFLKIKQVSARAYETAMSAVKPVSVTRPSQIAARNTATAPAKMDRITAASEALKISKATGESYKVVFARLTA
jgi:hypothetical protein